MNIIHEQECDGVNFAMIEIDTQYYVVELDRDRNQVKSAITADGPDSGGQWFADFTDDGVKYVARPRTRNAARQYFNQLTQEDNP